MSFLYPTYLWALVGLLVPLAIHLWNTRKVKTIKVGSTRFIEEIEPPQSRSINIKEWWLLLLRSLAILVLTLILAQPQWKIGERKRSITYIVEPSLAADKSIRSYLDSIAGDELLLLRSGFPELEDYDLQGSKNPSYEVPNYWQLALEMEDLASDSIVVFTQGLTVGIKGKRPKLSSKINWRIIDRSAAAERVVQAVSRENGVELLVSSSNDDYLTFKKETVARNSGDILIEGDSIKLNSIGLSEWLPLHMPDTTNIAIVYTQEFAKEEKYIRAAFNAVAEYLDRVLKITSFEELNRPNISEFDHAVWLSVEEPPANSNSLLKFKPDSLANRLIEPGHVSGVFYLTDRLNTENIIDAHLGEQLLKMLDFTKHIETRAAQHDRRTSNIHELKPGVTEEHKNRSHAKLLKPSNWLWILLVGVLIVERILAKYRKQ